VTPQSRPATRDKTEKKKCGRCCPKAKTTHRETEKEQTVKQIKITLSKTEQNSSSRKHMKKKKKKKKKKKRYFMCSADHLVI